MYKDTLTAFKNDSFSHIPIYRGQNRNVYIDEFCDRHGVKVCLRQCKNERDLILLVFDNAGDFSNPKSALFGFVFNPDFLPMNHPVWMNELEDTWKAWMEEYGKSTNKD